MISAQTSKRLGGKSKLLVLSGGNQVQHSTVGQLSEYLSPGDLLIVNRSATLPSTFHGILQRTGEPVEIRLAAFQGPETRHLQNWLAVSFGGGDWSIPTEQRGEPPQITAGDRIVFGPDLSMLILECRHFRLLRIRFESSQLERNLYKFGKPIQYSYLKEELNVWDQQTLFSGPPISVEPPSASFPLTWDLVFRLREKGVVLADILHGTGISSTGSADLDARLPLTEYYDIPQEAAEKFRLARQSGKKIIAIGTTVLRATESAWQDGTLRAGHGLTDLKISANHRIQSATAIVTGMHEAGTSHMNILNSFCPAELIRAGYGEAERLGYRGHEYGDLALLQCGCR